MAGGTRPQQVTKAKRTPPLLQPPLLLLLLLLLCLGPTTSLGELPGRGGDGSGTRELWAGTRESAAASGTGRLLTQIGRPRVFHSGHTQQARSVERPLHSGAGKVGRRRHTQKGEKSLLHTREFQHGGYTRQYKVYFPSLPSGRLPREGLPLLVALHCFGCSDTTFEYLTQYCEVFAN